jgi:hypothetical protein
LEITMLATTIWRLISTNTRIVINCHVQENTSVK